MFPLRVTFSYCLSLLVFLAPHCRAREIVHLTTGFALEALSHQQRGDNVVLQTGSGTTELPVAQIEMIEVIPDSPERSTDARPDLAEVLRIGASSQGTAPEFIRLVRSVALVESALHENAVSPRGALGLMQLMPGTARDLGVDPADVRQNITGGAKYLRDLLLRYNNDSVLALAAYNAGPGAVSRFGGVPPYLETRRYIEKVLSEYEKGRAKKTGETAARAIRTP